jgi:hypothetical protein
MNATTKRSLLGFVLLGFLLLGASACQSPASSFTPAENGLDAVREFTDAQLKGDFERARFYMVIHPTNQALLGAFEKEFRALDKTGRENWRSTSLQIARVEEPSDSLTIVWISHQVDTAKRARVAEKTPTGWKVNYSRIYP